MAKNVLSFAELLRLDAWLTAYWPRLRAQKTTTASAARQAQSELGFVVTVANLRHVLIDTDRRLPSMRAARPKPEVGAMRQEPREQRKAMPANLRRIETLFPEAVNG
jgi:hypothetical protein